MSFHNIGFERLNTGFGNCSLHGYLKPVTGVSPLTLSNCISRELKSFTISGNSVQDTTPAADAPVEIKSCGDVERALLAITYASNTANGITWTSNENSSLTISGTATAEINRAFCSFDVTPNTEYSLKLAISGVAPMLFVWDSTNSVTLLSRTNMVDGTTYNFTTADTTKRVALSMYIPSGDTVDCELSAQIWETDKSYKIPVKYKGLNLANQAGVLSLYSSAYPGRSDGGFTLTNKESYLRIARVPCKIEEGKTYIVTLNQNRIIGTQQVKIVPFGLGQYPSIGKSFVALGSTSYIGIYVDTAATDGIATDEIEISDVMVTEGSTAKTYEPYYEPVTHNVYIPEQINGIGGVADSVELVVGDKVATLTKQFGVKVFDGSENVIDMSQYAGAKENVANFCLHGLGALVSGQLASTHLPRKAIWTSVDAEGVYSQSTGKVDFALSYERLGITSEATASERVAACKAWLTAQSEAGTPFTVVYQLATPATEDISDAQDWESVPKLNRGTTIITVETETDPSAMTVEYYSRTKE